MKATYPMLRGFLLPVVCSAAFAEQQALITVDPNNFAPGQDISTATYGATLRSVIFIPNPDPNAPPEQAFVSQYSPVLVETVTPNCVLAPPPPLPLPCAPIGNSVLSYTSSSIPQSFPVFWGDVRHAIGCFDPQQGSCFTSVLFPLLRVDFAVPTDSVSVIMGNFSASDGDIESFTAVAAFDETGTNLASCSSNFPVPGSGCSNTVIVGSAFGSSWTKVTFSDPSARIRFIVTGASTDAVPLGVVQFDSPVSVQLTGLLAKVNGVGPGKSLANQMMFAQTFYAVSDIQSTCATLTGFMNTVRAQTGKSIDRLTASQLLATAQAIEVALACKY